MEDFLARDSSNFYVLGTFKRPACHINQTGICSSSTNVKRHPALGENEDLWFLSVGQTTEKSFMHSKKSGMKNVNTCRAPLHTVAAPPWLSSVTSSNVAPPEQRARHCLCLTILSPCQEGSSQKSWSCWNSAQMALLPSIMDRDHQQWSTLLLRWDLPQNEQKAKSAQQNFDPWVLQRVSLIGNLKIFWESTENPGASWPSRSQDGDCLKS